MQPVCTGVGGGYMFINLKLPMFNVYITSGSANQKGVLCTSRKLCGVAGVVIFLFLISLGLGAAGAFYFIQGAVSGDKGDLLNILNSNYLILLVEFLKINNIYLILFCSGYIEYICLFVCLFVFL